MSNDASARLTRTEIGDDAFRRLLVGVAVIGIIEDHNGRIEVDTKVGRGTSFTLVFPVAEP